MASTIKQRLRRYNGTDYDTVHLETQESQIIANYSKYAPAGYGLGSSPILLTAADDLDHIVKPGWYYWLNDIPKNAPLFHGSALTEISQWCSMHITHALSAIYSYPTGYAGEVVYQVVRTENFGDIRLNVEQCRVIRYDANDSSYNSAYPWEWIRPLLFPGFEYRTIERCNGKPVYAQRFVIPTSEVDTGYDADGNFYKYLFIDSAVYHTSYVRSSIDLNGYQLPTMMYSGGAQTEANHVFANIRCSDGDIQFWLYSPTKRILSSTTSSREISVTVYYTKIAD